MYVKNHVVTSARLILDEDNLELFYKCTGEIRNALYGLPSGGTLLVDMGGVLDAREPFLFDMVATLQSTNGGLLKDKHLLLFKPRKRVLQALINVLDEVTECAMVMDKDYAITPIGNSLNKSHLKVFHAVFKADKENLLVSPTDVVNYEKNMNPQVCAESLRRLNNWGFLQRQEQPGNRGRPIVRYLPFWPVAENYFPPSKVHWEIPLPNDTNARYEKYYYPVNDTMEDAI